MEIRHLKYFLTLADELHFGKAADKLFISQPPLSRLVKSLENELGVQLFERNNRNVKLTRYGEYLKLEASDIMTRINRIKNHLKLMNKGAISPVRIGYVASVMYVFLPDVLKKLKIAYPDAGTVLIEISDINQYSGFTSGELDIGFVRSPVTVDGFTFEHIYDESFTLIYSDRHKFSTKETITVKHFKDEPFITFTASCSSMVGIKSILSRNKITPNIVHRTSQINTILRLVESNVGYAIIPSSVLKGYNLKLNRIELTGYPERTPIYITYKKAEINDIVKDFIQIVKGHSIVS